MNLILFLDKIGLTDLSDDEIAEYKKLQPNMFDDRARIRMLFLARLSIFLVVGGFIVSQLVFNPEPSVQALILSPQKDGTKVSEVVKLIGRTSGDIKGHPVVLVKPLVGGQPYYV
jgi:hypothetical protein